MYACHFGYDGEVIPADKWSAVEMHVVSELPEYDESYYYMIRDHIVLLDRAADWEEEKQSNRRNWQDIDNMPLTPESETK